MLGIVLICYNNHDELIAYINEELVKITYPFRAVIIDNSISSKSHDILLDFIENSKMYVGVSWNKNIAIIKAGSNLGYAKANNLGAIYLNQNFRIRYLLFSNSDIKFEDDNVVEHLISELEKLPSVGAINPKIIGVNRKDQSPMKRVSIWRHHILKFMFYPFFRTNTTLVSNAEKGNYHRLMGCFLLVRNKVFLEADLFDSNTFLFGEELILAERMRGIGYLSHYDDKKIIIHNNSQTIKKSYNYLSQIEMAYKSELYFFIHYLKENRLELSLSKISFLIFKRIYFPVLILLDKIRKAC